MEKIKSILVAIIGILLVLPLLGVTAMGTVTTGATAWIIALSVLVIGIIRISESFRE